MQKNITYSVVPRPLVRVNQWTIIISVVITWITGLQWFLLIPFVLGLGGILFDYNPVMKLARLFLKKDIRSYVPEDKSQQKFNQIIACIFLGLAFIGSFLHWNVLFYVSSIVVVAAAFVAILGFCVGCFVLFRWKQFLYRRKNKHP